MAASNENSGDLDSLVSQCCAITGCSTEVAKGLIEACAGNLEMAINMHLEGNAGSSSNSTGAATACTSNAEEDEVRAPIPQRTEMLVEEGYQYGFRSKRRKGKSVFDGFRDFQAEAKQQEAAQKSAAFPSTSTSSAASKRKTLEDLFRPPIDLLHHGSFQSARDQGTNRNRWVLVNIQNVQEFPCQVLNRDVWSNVTVRDIVKRSFVFWQVYHDSSEGQKYVQFYPITDWPYVAIIDPRTGEKMVSWSKLDATTFCDLIGEFLERNPAPDGSTSSSPPSKKMKRSSSIVEASEDSQLEAAIRASMQQQTSSNKDSESSEDSEPELETFTDSDDDKEDDTTQDSKDISGKKKTGQKLISSDGVVDISQDSTCSSSKESSIRIVKDSGEEDSRDSEGSVKKTVNGVAGGDQVKEEKWKFYLGNEEDEGTKLMLRFPDGNKKQLTIPCSSRLMALVQYVIEEGFSNERYELVTNFPRRKLSHMDFDQTLKELGLHPQESIFVQKR